MSNPNLPAYRLPEARCELCDDLTNEINNRASTLLGYIVCRPCVKIKTAHHYLLRKSVLDLIADSSYQ